MSNTAPPRATSTVSSHTPVYQNVHPLRKIRTIGQDWSCLLKLAQQALKDSEFSAAEELLVVALQNARKNNASASAIADITQNLAEITYLDQRYEESLIYCQQAKDATSAMVGSAHPRYAACANLLASIHFAQGRYPQAQIECEIALAIFEKSKGRAHSDVVVALFNLGLINHALNKFLHSEKFFLRALGACRENGDNAGISYKQILCAYGNMLSETGRLVEAQRLSIGNF